MDKKNTKCVHVWDIVSLYSNSDMINRFSQGIGFSSTWHKEDLILEPCSEMERANMKTVGKSSTPYFYFHLHAIHDLGVLVPFTLFEVDFFKTVNVAPS